MGRHRRRRGHVRAGLVGASATLTVGAVAAGAGLLPGLGEGLGLNNDTDDVRAQEQRTPTRPGTLTPAPSTELGAQREETPEEAPSTEPAEETTGPSEESPSPTPEESSAEPTTPAPEPTPEETESTTPAPTTPAEEPAQTPGDPPTSEEPSATSAPETAMAEAVLTLVNEERADVGCRPLTLDTELSRLAADFSRDMAERGFFDHTDPDGLTPWDRALTSGITNLGGENIARGQQDAQAVMDAWMASDGHRENILNCEFTTLGVGVHLGDGGPWWTQDFGY